MLRQSWQIIRRILRNSWGNHELHTHHVSAMLTNKSFNNIRQQQQRTDISLSNCFTSSAHLIYTKLFAIIVQHSNTQISDMSHNITNTERKYLLLAHLRILYTMMADATAGNQCTEACWTLRSFHYTPKCFSRVTDVAM